MLSTRHILATLFTLLLFLAPFRGRAREANMPVDQRLMRIESEHFIVVYSEPLADRMPALVRECELAHEILSPILRWAPREKTWVFFHDGQDEHNGWSTTYPRAMISFYASGPSPSSIYEPGGYLRSTLWHEYTHVLTTDARYGAGGWLGRLLGRAIPDPPYADPLTTLLGLWILPPGLLAPEWYLEGMSIWSETEFTRQGRGRQAYADMVLRMAVSEDRMVQPDRWFFGLPEWPRGNVPYLWGARAIQYLQTSAGSPPKTNLVGEVADSVNHSFLWFFNNRSKTATGKSFGELAAEALQAETEAQNRSLSRLQTHPLTALSRLTPAGLQAAHPVFSPDGASLFFVGGREDARDVLHRLDLASGVVLPLETARLAHGPSSLTANRAAGTVLYTRPGVTGRDRIYNRLYEYDPATGHSRTLDERGRYRFPCVSPDGTRLAAVRSEGGVCTLVEVPLASAGDRSKERILAQTAPFEMIVDPCYSPDGRSVAFVVGRESESEIRVVQPDSGQTATWLKWPCILLAPAFHPAGKELVFSADRSGVFNLYRMPAGGGEDPRPLTHVAGGLFDPEFSPDGSRLTATAYDSSGFYAVLFNRDELKPLGFALPEIRREWPSVAANQEKLRIAEAREPPVIGPPVPYRSLQEIRPDGWIPWASNEEGKTSGGLAMSLSDPVGIHSISMLGGYDGEPGITVGRVVYRYSGLYPVLTLFGANMAHEYDDLLVDALGETHDYEEKVSGGGIAMTLPWNEPDHALALTLGYQLQNQEALTQVRQAGVPPLISEDVFQGLESSVFILGEYFDGTAYPASHSVEGGRRVSLGVDRAGYTLGGDLDQIRHLVTWDEYITLPWGRNHVLKLGALYGWSTGEQTAQGAFSVGGMERPIEEVVETPGVVRFQTLRGYEKNTQVGDAVAGYSAAYRFPLLRAFRGLDATSPIFRRQLYGEVFYEAGRAWDGATPEGFRNPWISSAGMELHYAFTLLRRIQISPGVGLAHGFDRQPGDRDQMYFSFRMGTDF